ncbi:HNH endonuclease [Mobilicoccus caccae]|uniref:HNH endonuclease n=1 Tax=Mobilicoccus caccae TaxID=1859295 RepID=A0ABQ6IWU8_9MICO|nr:HNH endonuclease [Mobilicoccus caccae]
MVQVERLTRELGDLARAVVSIPSGDLAAVAAAASALVSAAEATRAAVVLEAYQRGVIAQSDHPRVDRWVEQSSREGGAPVARAQARQLKDVASVPDGGDLAVLRRAIIEGRVPMEAAATVARVFRRWRSSIDYGDWDVLLETLIGWAAEGAVRRELEALEDMVIGQYGTAGALDAAHERDYQRRELTAFRRDHAGMLCATLRLDPASEAVFTAAIHATSAPRPGDDGALDERTPGQRRADALLALVGGATTPSRAMPGSGSKARVVITMTLQDLLSGIADHAAGDSAGHGAFGGQRVSTERGYGRTGFAQALSPTEVRMLACDAQIIPAVLGGTGELLELGHTKRLITPGLGYALQLRDKGCSFPGCTAPPSWCDGHHITHWAAGGRTDLNNLALLCRHHHVEVHRKGHTATVDDDEVHWVRSDGTPIGNRPRPDTPLAGTA